MGSFLKLTLVSSVLLCLTACSLDVSVLGKKQSQSLSVGTNVAKGIFPLGVAKFDVLNLASSSFAITSDGTYVIATAFNDDCPIAYVKSDGTFKKCLIPSTAATHIKQIALDSQNNLYVSLSSTSPTDIQKVVKYNSLGQLIFTVGNATGTGNGEFNTPGDIIIDSNGTFLVADVYNCRVQRFDTTTGSFISTFGSQGTNNGEIDNMILGIAVDGSRNIYIRESNGRVQKFTSAGSYTSTFDGVTSGVGSNFELAGKIAVDSGANLYVVDGISSKIHKISPSNTHVWTYNGASTSDPLNSPLDLHFGSNGNLFINNQQAIIEIKPDSTFVSVVKAGSPTFAFPTSIALEGNGKMLVGQMTGDIVRSDANANITMTINTGGKIPLSIVVDSKGSIYTLLTTDTQVFTLKKYNHDGVEIPNFASTLVTNPLSIAIDENDVLYIVDKNGSNVTIKKVSTDGSQIGGDLATGLLTAPTVISVSPDGSNIVVFDSGLIRLNNAGNMHAQQYDTSGAPGSITSSFGMWQDGDGHLYVTDYAPTKELVKFDNAGTPVGRYGQSGMSYGLILKLPFGITGDIEGNVYVADAVGKNVQKFNSSGQQQFE
ncbi:hypothetical protein B9G69_010200 [Bdellovibrio sp. SKB1291214]|uniref:hypothetical protein n=1 Tax=Bdellovibrio sp. SKB1291214 TaxID=1732569 RepID=UPI000B518D90|nr:hypothetical protein [Bdellovibrio sp. SKB1291214]UYL07416.1 hypothetical protein B9G69_010200 [Bdellovibrio sp. SKB1291214]